MSKPELIGVLVLFWFCAFMLGYLRGKRAGRLGLIAEFNQAIQDSMPAAGEVYLGKEGAPDEDFVQWKYRPNTTAEGPEGL